MRGLYLLTDNNFRTDHMEIRYTQDMQETGTLEAESAALALSTNWSSMEKRFDKTDSNQYNTDMETHKDDLIASASQRGKPL